MKINELRSKVATMANRLASMGMSLSEAFTKAWSIAHKGGISTKVKGVSFGVGQKALERLTHYGRELVTVSLVREVANLYDKNAVAVHVGVIGKGSVKVGYLPTTLAKVIAALLDKGTQVNAVFEEIRGKYESYMFYGLQIAVVL